ncbi:autotransporter outer membrane beta-barrel domain-containing protein [Variovorax boronicumulans]|uniref:autotransporter outer membrane beta-barrel domain-containing protein n=1 Tax=Variovorax boronicumulans TaxID=436515 RepID=UPI0036F32740
MGQASSGTGSATVTGAGSTWNIYGPIRVGSAGTGTLRVEDGAAVSSERAYAGWQAGGSGTVIVTGKSSTLTAINEVNVGSSGKGEFRIENGAKVFSGGGAFLGNGAQGVGTVTATGPGSAWTHGGGLTVGAAGQGTLGITDGAGVSNAIGRIGAQAGSSGTVNVVGGGSTWTNTALLYVGDAGTGTLDISAGATVSSDGAQVGQAANGSGTVTVRGPGSTWDVQGIPYIGVSGTGTVEATDGALLRTEWGYIGHKAGGVGTVTVRGQNSEWSNGGSNIYVGNGGKGTLNVEQGGRVRVANVSVAEQANSVGNVRVHGTDAAGNASELRLYDFYVGNSGKGTLRIEGGGSVRSSNGTAGVNAGSEGRVTVSGAAADGQASTWTTDKGASLRIGDRGVGDLRIEAGGQVTSGSGVVGRSSGGVGTVTVTGVGSGAAAGTPSTWTSTGKLMVGQAGQGTLSVEAGGKLSSGGGSIGEGATGVGSATLTGKNTLWNSTGDFHVGENGQGTLRVENGAALSSDWTRLGVQSASQGTATVTGAGSSWTSASDFTVGLAGKGTLAVLDGATLAANGATTAIGSNPGGEGAVRVADAKLDARLLYVGQEGTGRLDVEHGGKVTATIRLTAGLHAGSTGEIRVQGTGAELVSANNILVGSSGAGTLIVDAGGTAHATSEVGIGQEVGSAGTVHLRGDEAQGRGVLIADRLVRGAGRATLDLDGGILRASADSTDFLSGFDDVALGSRGAYIDTAGHTVIVGSAFSSQAGDSSGLVKEGAGLLALRGASTYVGDTTINGGTLGLAGGGQLAATTDVRLANAGARFDIASANGNRTIGALLGVAGTEVVLGGNTLSFGDAGDTTFAGAIIGLGGVVRQGSGSTTLTGTNTYTGGTTIDGGTLRINGSVAGDVQVNNGGTLAGAGSTPGTGHIGGNVTVGNADTSGARATLSPGNSPGTLTIGGSLRLNPSATTVFELGQPGVAGGASNDLLNVGGNLALGGTLQAGVAAAGWYRLINYAGSLSGSFAQQQVSSSQSGFNIAAYSLDTGTAGQVNLAVRGVGQTIQFWNGPNHTANGTVSGGPGTWSGLGTNWANATPQGGPDGNSAVGWGGSVGVFGGTGGSVAVQGTLLFDTLQFSANGYHLQAPGGSGSMAISPASGTAATLHTDAGVSARISAPIVDGATGNRLVLGGAGVLALTGASTYTGGTMLNSGALEATGNGLGTGTLTINGGILARTDVGNQVRVNGNFGVTGSTTLSGPVELGADTRVTATAAAGSTSATGMFAGPISGAGGLTFDSDLSTSTPGLFYLFGASDNSYTGTTTARSNVRLILARQPGHVAVPGDFTIEGTASVSESYSEQIADSAQVTVNSPGVLAAPGEFGGVTPVLFEGLMVHPTLGLDALTETIGSLHGTGTVGLGSGTLRVGSGEFGGQISNGGYATWFATVGGPAANGKLVKYGPGTLTLSGDNSYTGGTTIEGGTLQVGNGGTSGSLTGDVANSGVLAFNRSNASTFAGVISGSGAVQQLGAGRTTFTGAHTYTGGTTVQAGTLALSGAGRLADAGTLRLTGSGATFDLSAADGDRQIGALSGVAGSVVALGAHRLTVDQSGGSSFAGSIHGSGGLTKTGAGTLTLAGASDYSGGTALKQGRLNLGHSSALGTGELAMDDGTTLGFSADGLTLANAIRMTGNNDPVIDTGSFSQTISGAISGGGFLTKEGTGTLTLSGTNTYTGATDVARGTLRAGASHTLSAASAHTVAAGATLDLAGFSQRVAGLTNAGTVSLHGSTPGTVLTVTGPWVGQGGTLALGTVLGGNGSPSDKVLLSGASAVASGTTKVRISNLGGLGARTTGNGIEVVGTEGGARIEGQAFALAAPVAAGAYEYQLKTTSSGAYLSNSLPAPDPVPPSTVPAVPTYRTEVPLYAAQPEQLRQANLAMLGSMHQRMGDDGAGSVRGADAEQGRRQAWGRILTVDREIQQGGTVSPSSKGRLTGFQAGTDLWADPNWRAGLYVGQLEGDMRVNGFARGIPGLAVGRNDLRSEYLGGYLTYRTDNGLYVDGVLQAGRHRTTLDTLEPSLGGASKGNSLLASIEVGQSFALGAGWSVEPQLQLVHQRLSLDNGVIVGSQVQQDTPGNRAVRAGLRVKGEFAVSTGTLQAYARLNVWHRGSGTDRTRFIGPAAFTDIVTPTGGSSTEAAVGATWQISPMVGVYGELAQMWSSGGNARAEGGPNASLGMKVRW